jgi:hypothetical protein
MDIYARKARWKLWLLAGAALIVAASLWYTGRLASKISEDEKRKIKAWATATETKVQQLKYNNQLFATIKEGEKKKVELWANAIRRLNEGGTVVDQFAFEVVLNNENVPVILTDERDSVIDMRNVEDTIIMQARKLTPDLKQRFTTYAPIRSQSQLVYYRNSKLFTELQTALTDLINQNISEIVLNSASVPVIFTDEHEQVLAFGNLDSLDMRDSTFVRRTVSSMKAQNDPIVIDLGDEGPHFVYYKDSWLLKQIRFYPYVQFGIIGIFLVFAYFAFNTAKRVEQNQVWVGMAKETAHQLGTPISSLAGWVELLRESKAKPELVDEIAKDTERLELIAERFSKIGSSPSLVSTNLNDSLRQSMSYMSKRAPKTVSFDLNTPDGQPVRAAISPPLFLWVIENLIRNALDAMNGQGEMKVSVYPHGSKVHIDLSDTGHGIAKSKFKTVFQPGYSTKARGWGLGLSLCKRIIENYHNGKIYVAQSTLGKGTTFRIVLPSSA